MWWLTANIYLPSWTSCSCEMSLLCCVAKIRNNEIGDKAFVAPQGQCIEAGCSIANSGKNAYGNNYLTLN
jgi:hypothetical protein